MNKSNLPLDKKKLKAKRLMNAGSMTEAKALLSKVSQKYKKDAEVWFLLGCAEFSLGNPRQAIASYLKSESLCPDNPETKYNLGCVYHVTGDLERAVNVFNRALVIQKNDYKIYTNLGMALKDQGKYDDALSATRQAERLNPDSAIIKHNLGAILHAQGFLDQAIRHYRLALQLNPHNTTIYSDLVFSLNYDPNICPEKVLAEHIRFSEILSSVTGSASTPTSRRDHTGSHSRVRVGYVSPDFRKHSVAYFLEPLIESHNSSGFEIFCYSDVRQPDEVTARFQQRADHWHDVHNMDDRQLTDMIRSHQIDILVDLAGHTKNNRLPVFARRPAPIQVSYLGYPCTTGLSSIDYRLTDPWADPKDMTDTHFIERLVRLNSGFLCYSPPEDAPPVSSLPATTTGQITFGSFNTLAKINFRVVETWAKILKEISDSRLIIKNRSMIDEATRERYIEMFRQRGIERKRLFFYGHTTSPREHLEYYHQVDISLDTFPYNGTTTTCEALWMGVPVITLAGNTHAGRVGVSLLSQAGYHEWATSDTENYIRIAVDMAGDIKRLGETRKEMRSKVEGSLLCNAKLFSDSVEDAYRCMLEDCDI